MLQVELPPHTIATELSYIHNNMPSRKSSSSAQGKRNLRQQSAQLYRGIPTSGQLNVCCAYCENYGKTMSKHKQEEITNWRNDVNRALSPATRRIKPRLRYMQDGHDGTAAEHASGPIRCTSVSAISLHLAEMALSAPGVETQPKTKSHNHKSVLSASRSSFGSYLSRSNGDNMFSHSYNDALRTPRMSHSADGTRMRARSSSNELLNVMTIDDCHRVHNHRPKVRNDSYHAETDYTSVSQKPESPENMPPLTYDNDESHNFKSSLEHTHNGSTHILSDMNSKSNMNLEDLMNEPNHAVLNALDNMIDSKEVIHNAAHRGLFKHDPSQRAKIVTKKESKRFRRMNDQLHRHIEEEILSKNYRLKPHKRIGSKSTDDQSSDEKLQLAFPDYVHNPNLRSSLRTPGDLSARTNKKRVQLQLPSNEIVEEDNVDQVNRDSNEKQDEKGKESFLQTLLDLEGGDTETLETSSVQAIN